MATETMEIEAGTEVEKLRASAVRGANVTAKQFTDAKNADELVQLKADASAQREAEEKEAVRLARIQEIGRAWREDLGTEEIEAAREVLQRQIESFVTLCAAFNARRLEIAAPLLGGSGELDPLPAGWKNYGYNIFRPAIDGVEVNPMNSQTEILKATVEAVKKCEPGAWITITENGGGL